MMKYLTIYYDWCGELHMSVHPTIELAIAEYRELRELYEEDSVWLTKVIADGEEI